jgi:hypothetical protein
MVPEPLVELLDLSDDGHGLAFRCVQCSEMIDRTTSATEAQPGREPCLCEDRATSNS